MYISKVQILLHKMLRGRKQKDKIRIIKSKIKKKKEFNFLAPEKAWENGIGFSSNELLREAGKLIISEELNS